jgi:phytochelatin synthase
MRKLAITALILVGTLFAAGNVYLSQISVPTEAIHSSVTRSEALLNRGWELPVAQTFKPALLWQSNPSTCGAASLANVFRSLSEPRTERQLLARTNRCWFGICVVGLRLDELAEVAKAHTTRKITVLRDLSPEQFRSLLRSANDPSRRLIVNFSRKPIFGSGGGHHSPIGGYLENEDLVFVLDVNRKFQPWLVERSRLFAAVDTLDGEKKRGALLFE